MKTFITIIRWFVGLLFIFSGLVKANDPLGLSYKMQEFFEVWGWHAFNDYTLFLSLVMNILEIGAGVAVIIGWRAKWVNWFLLLLIVFFTFLTGYALFSGKIKTCGCFGDCLPLTPAMSFGKDLLLLVLILFLLAVGSRIKPAVSDKAGTKWVLVFVVLTALLQWYVLYYLPLVDCLPYKKGNNLLEQMQTPANAIPDSFSIVFTYKKDGKAISFDQMSFPADFDSTYEYIDRSDKLVRKGNGLTARIVDFSLQSMSGTDTTTAILQQPGKYVLLFARDMSRVKRWRKDFESFSASMKARNISVTIVTADASRAAELFPGTPLLKCDATVIKTAARVNPTYFLMEGAQIREKVSYNCLNSLKP